MDIATIFKEFSVLPREEELALIKKYQEGDTEAGNEVLTTRMAWIYYIVRSLNLPSWVNEDEVASDVAADIAISLRNYKPDRSSVSTYLHKIIRVQSWAYANGQKQEFDSALEGDYVEPEIKDPSEVIAMIRDVFHGVDMNEKAQIILDRMLRGINPHEIGRQTGWKREEIHGRIKAVRQEIAWRMRKAGHSAAPWIQDKDLEELASEYEENQFGLFG